MLGRQGHLNFGNYVALTDRLLVGGHIHGPTVVDLRPDRERPEQASHRHCQRQTPSSQNAAQR